MTHEEFIKRLIDRNPNYINSYIVTSQYLSNKEPITVKHVSCGTEFTSIPMRVMRGQGCPNCYSKKKKTTSEFKEEIFKLVGDEYSILSEYSGCKVKVTFKHSCGNTFNMNPDDFLQGQRCPKCSRSSAAFKTRKSHNEFIEKIKSLVNESYEVLSEYKTNKDYVMFKHKECGNTFNMIPVNFYRGHRCPFCNGTPKKTTSEISGIISSSTNNEYKLISEYKNTNTKISILHTHCGNKFTMLPNNFIKKGNRCPFCFGNNKLTTEEYKERVAALDDNYDVIGEYININTKILMKHKVCGHEFNMRPSDFLYREHKCPSCAHKSSKEEKEILEYIKSFYNGNIRENVKFNYDDKDSRKYHEADILIEDQKVIIEFNGIFWHSTMNRKDSKYHLNKTIYFNSLGYRTIHIFEDEWVNKKDIVKKKLKHILKCDNDDKIYARKCSVVEIDSKSSAKFLDSNHIQGNAVASIRYALTYDNDIVAVMTLAKPRIAMGQKHIKEGSYELIRYATSKNVVGGFSKLLNYIMNKHTDITELITYADIRYSPLKNSVYEKNGFELVSQTEPNYYYYNGLEKHYRFSFRKQNLEKLFPNLYDDSLTEFEIMDKTNYLRIYDCGNLKFIKKKKD